MSPKTVAIALAVGSVALGALALFSIGPVAFVPMMFDAPGSTENPGSIALALSVATFPLTGILAIALAWIAYGLARWGGFAVLYPWACAALLLPVLNVAAAALAIAGLNVANGGRLN